MGERVQIVFIHGVLSSGAVWADFKRLIQSDPELGERVDARMFEYTSPKFVLRPGKRIPELTDLAELLDTYLSTPPCADGPVVLVGHSQGGLIVQRYLGRMVIADRALELARIKRVVLFACPSNGSEFLGSVRRWLGTVIRHPQERELRPFDRAVADTLKVVLRCVVNTSRLDEGHCPISFDVYGGTEDAIVTSVSAQSSFPHAAMLPGTHKTIVRPKNADAPAFQCLKTAVLVAAASAHAQPAPPVQDVPDEGFISLEPPYRAHGTSLIGRSEQLAEICAKVQLGGRIQVLVGPPGAGKTRLAVAAAARHRAARSVWWVHTPQINLHMQKLATQLGVPESLLAEVWRIPGLEADTVWRYLARLQEPWLLIFDNADDPELLRPPLGNGSSSGFEGWLRVPPENGAVIVTSRDADSLAWAEISVKHHVDPLAPDDGAAMLLELTDARGGGYRQARELSTKLGGLPLALHLAAAYLNEQTRTDSEAVEGLYARYGRAIDRLAENTPSDQPADVGRYAGLGELWLVYWESLDLLARRGLHEASPLLALLAGLGPAPVPYQAVLQTDILGSSPLFPGISAVRLRELLDALAGVGLIALDSREGVEDQNLRLVLTMHPVVHGVFRNVPSQQDDVIESYRLAVRLFVEAVHPRLPDESSSWETWGALAYHVIQLSDPGRLAAMRAVGRQILAQAVILARLLARYMIVNGLLHPCAALVTPLIEQCKDFGFDRLDPEILALRHEEGRIAIERREPELAEELLRGVLKDRLAVLGPDHFDTLATRHKVARAILDQGRWAEAVPLLESIVEAELARQGPESSDTVTVRHSLARAILNQDGPGRTERLRRAEEMLRDILSSCEQFWTPDASESLWVRESLAQALLEQRRPDEAAAELDHALELAGTRERTLRAMHLRFVQALVMLELAHLPQAEAILIKLHQDQIETLGAEHPDLIRSRDLLDQIQGSLPGIDDEHDASANVNIGQEPPQNRSTRHAESLQSSATPMPESVHEDPHYKGE